jgi:hypothetical protein
MACRETDRSLRFPSREATDDTYALARSICNGCEVRDECLALALTTSPEGDVGIWAGTTPSERGELREDDGIAWDA